MKFEPDSDKFYKFRKTKTRTEILRSAVERYLPLISQSSDSQAVDQAVRLGNKYLDRMRDAKKEHERLEEEIQELRERQRELKEKWETGEISFEDV